ncbi:MAG: NUDIX domain-containing protein [Roseburia sp.]
MITKLHLHKDEDKKEALIREVREEVGLIVIPESICEFGSVMRRQKSNVSPNTIFEQENFYYMCKTKNRICEGTEQIRIKIKNSPQSGWFFVGYVL